MKLTDIIGAAQSITETEIRNGIQRKLASAIQEIRVYDLRSLLSIEGVSLTSETIEVLQERYRHILSTGYTSDITELEEITKISPEMEDEFVAGVAGTFLDKVKNGVDIRSNIRKVQNIIKFRDVDVTAPTHAVYEKLIETPENYVLNEDGQSDLQQLVEATGVRPEFDPEVITSSLQDLLNRHPRAFARTVEYLGVELDEEFYANTTVGGDVEGVLYHNCLIPALHEGSIEQAKIIAPFVKEQAEEREISDIAKMYLEEGDLRTVQEIREMTGVEYDNEVYRFVQGRFRELWTQDSKDPDIQAMENLSNATGITYTRDREAITYKMLSKIHYSSATDPDPMRVLRLLGFETAREAGNHLATEIATRALESAKGNRSWGRATWPIEKDEVFSFDQKNWNRIAEDNGYNVSEDVSRAVEEQNMKFLNPEKSRMSLGRPQIAAEALQKLRERSGVLFSDDVINEIKDKYDDFIGYMLDRSHGKRMRGDIEETTRPLVNLISHSQIPMTSEQVLRISTALNERLGSDLGGLYSVEEIIGQLKTKCDVRIPISASAVSSYIDRAIESSSYHEVTCIAQGLGLTPSEEQLQRAMSQCANGDNLRTLQELEQFASVDQDALTRVAMYLASE